MSCLYVLWDVIGACSPGISSRSEPAAKCVVLDDTIARKVNSSDASAFAKICGCFPSQGTPSTLFYYFFAMLKVLKSVGRHLAHHRLPFLHLGHFHRPHRIQGSFSDLPLSPCIYITPAPCLMQESTAQQKSDAKHFLPVPGSSSALALPVAAPLALLFSVLSSAALALL